MLSEEEKEAIDDLFSLTHINGYIDLYTQKKAKIHTLDLSRWQNGVKVLLNLIDNQQKEIEEWRNGIRINDNVTIPKDKIRAKIQIYKDKKADSVGMLINYEYWKTKIEVLQELLEENTNEFKKYKPDDFKLVDIRAEIFNRTRSEDGS